MAGKDVSGLTDFIREQIEEHLLARRFGSRVATRFPPEPNGYLHIGHAKSICLNFGIARQYGGTCNLRMDDTDPAGESQEYVDSIIEDVKWLGFDWGDRLYFASDYYEYFYAAAVELIKRGKAYVCQLSPEESKRYRGSLTEPGTPGPYRERPIEENLALFAKMRAGEYDEGSHVLRAKIDMASPNMLMRDPVIFRIKKLRHYRTGDKWSIYPMYDFAHCLSDSMENITHSICTLEFENNRPLYDWILAELNLDSHPQQIEFARLNLSFTVLSKRKLIELVDGGYVKGWDDPRLPTIAGMRRRGYTPQAIKTFCECIGVSKNDSIVDFALLEHCVRDNLNETALRVMAVLKPLKVVIDNYPADCVEEFNCPYHPQNADYGFRKVPFSRVIYIEQDDFMENPVGKFFRLAPGREVRLRYGYFIKCTNLVKDQQTGEVLEVHCQYDPATRNGFAPDGRKVGATIHWVSAAHASTASVRLYDRLFSTPNPLSAEGNFLANINPDSLVELNSCKIEPSLAAATPATAYQFERQGYFILDSKDSSPGHPVFNRTVGLRDSWLKVAPK